MYCQKCGKEIPDRSRYCRYCGSTQQTNDISWASDNPTKEISPANNKSKEKKVGIIILIAITILFLIVIFGGGDKNVELPEDNTTTTESFKATSNDTKNNVGNFNVRLKNAVVTTDDDGEKVLLVTYTFTNNSDKNAAFYMKITDTAFQNGIELETPMFNNISGYDHNLKAREIQPGKSLDVQNAFYLDDSSSDVEIQLSKWISNEVSDTIMIKLK